MFVGRDPAIPTSPPLNALLLITWGNYATNDPYEMELDRSNKMELSMMIQIFFNSEIYAISILYLPL